MDLLKITVADICTTMSTPNKCFKVLKVLSPVYSTEFHCICHAAINGLATIPLLADSDIVIHLILIKLIVR